MNHSTGGTVCSIAVLISGYLERRLLINDPRANSVWWNAGHNAHTELDGWPWWHPFMWNPVFGRVVICFWHISLWFHTLMHIGLTFLQKPHFQSWLNLFSWGNLLATTSLSLVHISFLNALSVLQTNGRKNYAIGPELETAAEKGRSRPFSPESIPWRSLQMPFLSSREWRVFGNHQNHCVTWSNGLPTPSPFLVIKWSREKKLADSQGAEPAHGTLRRGQVSFSSSFPTCIPSGPRAKLCLIRNESLAMTPLNKKKQERPRGG